MSSEIRARFRQLEFMCVCGHIGLYQRSPRQWSITCRCGRSYALGLIVYPIAQGQGTKLLPPEDTLFPRAEIGEAWRSGERVHELREEE